MLEHALEQVSERAHERLRSRLNEVQHEGTHQLHWADALLRVIIAKRETDQGQRRMRTASEGARSAHDPHKVEQESLVHGRSQEKESILVISAQQKYLISRLTKVAAIEDTIRTSGTRMTVIDFSLLTRKGYLNVLADLNGF